MVALTGAFSAAIGSCIHLRDEREPRPPSSDHALPPPGWARAEGMPSKAAELVPLEPWAWKPGSVRRASPSIPPAVRQAFGSAKARPKVARAYRPIYGLRKVPPQPVLTTATAVRLREEGVLEVELVWRWRRRRMTLTTGPQSVWGTAATQPPKTDEAHPAA
jgi:hypothetical protein